ncbi:protein ImuA [Novosphingobium sp. CF614]|nr:protein ImuA [Novosphingobium sp. CF614]
MPDLAAGHLHEIHAGEEDRAAAMAFALSAIRAGNGKAPAETPAETLAEPLFLVRWRSGSCPAVLCGEGLAMLGLAPARLVIVEAGNELELLRAGLEAARCPGVGAILLETRGRLAGYDLTASRRLALAAERTRGRVIVLRIAAAPRPSAAQTRWSVAGAPSVPLAADAPGWPAIDVELLRRRDGPAGGRWRLEWDAEQGSFRETGDETAIPGTVVALSSLRTGAAGGRSFDPRAA